MYAILKKEIRSFFASPVGYLVISLFLILNGLFLWVFKGEFNIFDYGFADLSAFFTLAPWILIFLIPAITMKSFSEENKMGTLELLLTKPLSTLQIVLGKYLGVFVLSLIALLPTLLYVFTVWKLGNPEGNIDLGSTFGSYAGLIFLMMSYTAIGVFSSILTDNQIVAFILGVFICFVFYFGFEGMADLANVDFAIEKWGMKSHFESMGRGVIDTRDLIYFLSLTGFFIFVTSSFLKNKSEV
ncbi:gliding motility-associated ABC transporter permease subunit GldF [Ascidiimonas sp. W6]|uniref:gliding motility-associated ABC transporter permease subunit GldF n=1 Tax=Ascidiimonas meishanensis TaxID=3128903 RepID=UPI0030EC0297